jgi:lipoate-protein ligase A
MILRSDSESAWFNLAVESWLLDHPPGEGPFMMLWRSSDWVVMGKHQNPWLECDLPAMAADKVPLARRVSGGGTVFHDRGNLNYSIFVPRAAYNPCLQYQVIIEALATMGLNVEPHGTSNLVIDGKKISGNAFCLRREMALHHGTLLIDADLDKMRRYLKPEPLDITTHAVRSEPASVQNLVDIDGFDEPALEPAIAQAFAAFAGGKPCAHINVHEIIPADLASLDSREWIYGHTPKFRMNDPGVEVKKGLVVESNDPRWTPGERFSL